jgi:hypothetical protein
MTCKITATESKWNAIYEKSNVSQPANFLVERGLDSHAWDISIVALHKLVKKAVLQNLNITVKHIDIHNHVLPKNEFDVIVVNRYLDRSLSNAIIDSLKVDGLLFYQTYTKEKVTAIGPSNREYLLDRNELLSLFKPLALIAYREN